MRAGVSRVVDEHRAVAQAGVDVVTVVQTPAAAPHWFTRIIGLNHRVGQQAGTKQQHINSQACTTHPSVRLEMLTCSYLVSLIVLSNAADSSRLSFCLLKDRPRICLLWMGTY